MNINASVELLMGFLWLTKAWYTLYHCLVDSTGVSTYFSYNNDYSTGVIISEVVKESIY